MKKSLIALAALAAAGVASAQTATAQNPGASAVTIFGVVDMSVTRLSTDSINGVNGGSQTIMDGSGRNASSRLGFRGVEDLGGGLGAAFWLEAGINVDNGTGSNTTQNNTSWGQSVQFGQTSTPYAPTSTLGARQGLTFNRASTVSLLGRGFGEVRLGRDYTTTFWNYTLFDPFGTVGVGAATNVIAGQLAPLGLAAFPPGQAYPLTRTSNAISWLSPNYGGFRAQLQYALSEQPSVCVAPGSTVNTNTCLGADGDGKVFGTRLSYANGPISAAFGYAKTKYGNNVVTTATATTISSLANTAAYRGDLTVWNLAGSYDFGVARVMAQYGRQTNDAVAAVAATATQAAGAAVGERELTHWTLATAVPMGPWTLKASYNAAKRSDQQVAGVVNENGAKNTQIALGAQYDLSKRTALYGTYSRNTLKAGSTTAGGLRATLGLAGGVLAAGQSATATGIDLGVRHSF